MRAFICAFVHKYVHVCMCEFAYVSTQCHMHMYVFVCVRRPCAGELVYAVIHSFIVRI